MRIKTLFDIMRDWRLLPARVRVLFRAWRNPPTGPRTVQIEHIKRCNLKCVMCPHGYASLERTPDLPLETFKKVVDEIHALGNLAAVHIQGLGEPFLSKDLLPMIRYAKSLGLQTHMITNMTIMTPQLAEALVLSGHDMLAISLDSPDPAVVAHIRRGAHFDVFERILRNIRMVRDAQQRLGRQTPEMVIYAISLKATLPRMTDFVAMCKDLGIRELCFQDLITQGIPDQACLPDGERLADQPLRSLSDAALKQAILEMKRHADDAVSIVPPHLFDNLILDKRFKNVVVSCLDLWERPAIGVDGTVTPCCFTLGAGTLDMGNILGQSFADIWHGQRYQALRWAHITGRPPEICRNCTQMFQWLDAPAGNGEHRHGYEHCYRSFFMGDRRYSLRKNGQ